MIAEYNNKSLLFGIPGILLQIGGRVAQEMGGTEAMAAAGLAAALLGTVLLMVGLAYYAKAKGRHPAWCLMAFLSIIGLIVLAVLKDQSAEESA